MAGPFLAPIPDPDDDGTIQAYRWIGSFAADWESGTIRYQRLTHRSAAGALAGKPPIGGPAGRVTIEVPRDGLPEVAERPVLDPGTPPTIDPETGEVTDPGTPPTYGDPVVLRPRIPGLFARITPGSPDFDPELAAAVQVIAARLYGIERSLPENAGAAAIPAESDAPPDPE